MSEFCRLPESELDVMLAVWKQGGEASAPEIGESLGRALTASALHSYLKRLEEKGFLRCRKAGKLNIYTALVSEADYRRAESGAVLGTVAEVLTPPAHEVYVVRGGNHEYMIPAVDEFLVETNVEGGYIKVRLIEGMQTDV